MSDPQVFTVGNLWYMMGYAANVGDWLAWTTQEAYPNGWTYGGTIVSAANQAGGRPVLTTVTGIRFCIPILHWVSICTFLRRL